MVPRLMARYVQFINEKDWAGLPPIIHALLAHFFITTIHPFEDGNGRVARLFQQAFFFNMAIRATDGMLSHGTSTKTKSNTRESFLTLHSTHVPILRNFCFRHERARVGASGSAIS